MLMAGAVWAQESEQAAEAGLNVNERYMVERVQVKRSPWQEKKISVALQKDLDKIVGQNLNQEELNALADRIKKDLREGDVNVKVAKGQTPDHVVVTFDVAGHGSTVALNVSQFLYHSKQGWSGEGEASYRHAGNKFTFGLVSERQIKELPLNGRSFDNLIALNPGAVNYTLKSANTSTSTGHTGTRASTKRRSQVAAQCQGMEGIQGRGQETRRCHSHGARQLDCQAQGA